MKTTWNTGKTVTARNCSDDNIHRLDVEGTIIHENQAIADTFHKHFSLITDIISDRNTINSNKVKIIILLITYFKLKNIHFLRVKFITRLLKQRDY
jgi:hypothetical protein